MRIFFYRIGHNIYAAFAGANLLAHIAAIGLTYASIASGFDWWWYEASRNVPDVLLYPGVILGALLPIVVPFVLLAVGTLRKNARIIRLAGALGQSALLGWLISSAYKAFTGRAHPTFGDGLLIDITRDFQLGLLRGGIFWGWPSSHTTVAFATATAMAVMYRGRKKVAVVSALYALCVGLSVSVSVHWFSDFLAGAIIGTVIGLVVGRSFRSRAAA